MFNIKLQEGESAYSEVMDDWIKNKDHEKWLDKHNSELNAKKIDSILETQYKMV